MEENILLGAVDNYIKTVDKLIMDQQVAIRTREKLEEAIRELQVKSKNNQEALDIATHAIEILREVSDEAVSQAYKFLEKCMNASLERMFTNTTRNIRLNEYTRNNQYPQLEIELTVANGKTRSLKADSGHGLAQIVSLLSILSLIVITNSRRVMVMDEVISGLSVHNRKIVTDILWTFTEIGFQFIVNDHGFIPKGSKVYHLEMIGDVSSVKDTYIEDSGVYLQGSGDGETNTTYGKESLDGIVELDILGNTGEVEKTPVLKKEDTEDIRVEKKVDEVSTGSNIISI